MQNEIALRNSSNELLRATQERMGESLRTKVSTLRHQGNLHSAVAIIIEKAHDFSSLPFTTKDIDQIRY
jgi:hypothetical protein